MNTNILFAYIKRTFRFIARKQFSFYRDFAKVSTTKLFINKVETVSPSLYNDNVNAYIVIFSKDRALQLHALLESYTIKVANNKNIFILYTTSASFLK